MTLPKITELKQLFLNKKLIIPCLFLVAILFIAFGGQKETQVKAEEKQDYAHILETRLKDTLSQIKGVGEVEVMVTLASDGETVVATDEKTNGTNIDKKVVTTNSKPIVIEELKPKLEGVIVIATGGNNPSVALQINQAVVALTGIRTHKVVVLQKEN